MKRILFVLAFFFLPALAWGQCPGIDQQVGVRPLGYQQLAVSSSAVGLTLPTVGTVRIATIMVEVAAVRYRDDGTNPTTTVGTLVQANVPVVLCGPSVAAFRAIAENVDASLSINFYGN